ncbi:unnamed protein product [Effrenium voratum]|uniref:EF-hand domain-containing protein n=1 Tax=Effrenium voratum TaxID=2562239 RepID=A0AA36JH36_9DINO|nr:unnamed protein product [Effrenium voratum]
MAESLSGDGKAIAVVGGGLAGVVAAETLAKAGRQVVLFDVGSRGLGGRCGHRETGAQRFDHGAQFLGSDGQGGEWRDLLAAWERRGLVSRWAPRLCELSGSGGIATPRPLDKTKPSFFDVARHSELYVSPGGMRRLCEGIVAEGAFKVVRQCRVRQVAREDGAWILHGNLGDQCHHEAAEKDAQEAKEDFLGRFRCLILCDVMLSFPEWHRVALLGLEREAPGLRCHAESENGAPLLADGVLRLAARAVANLRLRRGRGAWVGWNHLKEEDCWVCVSTREFADGCLKETSMAHSGAAGSLSYRPQELGYLTGDPADQMLQALLRLLNLDAGFRGFGACTFQICARLREVPVEGPCLDPELRIAACGDFCGVSGAKDAAASALRVAEAVMVLEQLRYVRFVPAEPAERARGIARSIALHGDFIKADTMSEHPEDNDRLQKLQMLANRAATHKYVTHFMAVVILFDAYCNCVDIDSRAELSPTPAYVAIGAGMCLLLYTIEMAILLFARGCVILKDFMVGIDLGVILCGYAEMILDGVTPDLAARIGILRILRLARIMRLLRLLRRTRALRELQKLVIMMSTCLKALLWSFVFCFVIMTIWAMLLVELVYPLILDMDKSTTVFSDCEQCIRATSSVMHANLLLFKTVIAGDSWGLIAVPVIETHPATAVIFVGSLLTLVFGVLNLIVAVVVDTFADARDRDILNLAEEMEADVDADRRFLEKMFNRIDSDGSGQLTLEQLVQGARKDHEFQSRLRVMDIDEIDLHQLFEMIDTDCSGFIEAPEFIRPLSRWVHDSKTAPRFIKYNMMRTMHQQDEMIKEQEDFRKFVQRQFHGVSQRIDDLASCLPPLISRRVPAYDSWERNVTEPLEELEEAHTREEDFVEQPRLSQKVTLKRLESQSEDGVKDAMERLGRIVLRATELALKDSSVRCPGMWHV